MIVQEFEKTLNQIRGLRITPVVFSPPPTNNNDLGRCLTRAEFLNIDLDRCNFKTADIIKSRRKAYELLENISSNFRVIRLDKLTCKILECQTNIDKTFIFRDGLHFSHEGSSALGEHLDFYSLITDVSKFE